jgi:hypothetical protein
VRRHFAGRPLTIAARPSIAPGLPGCAGVDHIKVLEPGKEATQIEADIGILFPNSFRSAWILKRAGVKERWGYGSDFRRLLLTRAVRRPKRRVAFPEYYSNLVRRSRHPDGTAGSGAEAGAGDTSGGVETSAGTADGTRSARSSASHPAPRSVTRSGGCQAGSWNWRILADEGGVTCVLLGRSEDRDACGRAR